MADGRVTGELGHERLSEQAILALSMPMLAAQPAETRI